MKTNEFFDNMYRIGCEWQERHEAHLKRKDAIIAQHGYGSPELQAWHAEKEEPFPFSSGANKAYRAWKYSPTDEVIMDDYCWDTERHDFIETLRKAGIKSFVTVNKSTGLMGDLHGYAQEGCEMLGLCTVSRVEDRFGAEKEERLLGIRFRL